MSELHCATIEVRAADHAFTYCFRYGSAGNEQWGGLLVLTHRPDAGLRRRRRAPRSASYAVRVSE